MNQPSSDPANLQFIPGKYKHHIFIAVSRRLILWILALIIAGIIVLVIFSRGAIGDLGPRAGRIARSGARAKFDSSIWKQRNEIQRGQMLADLARTQRFVGKDRTNVVQLLGRGECYVHYEDEPCYTVRLGDRRYQLEFWVNHSSAPGRVIAVKLRQTPT
jgi:hypothetical protein